MIFISHRGNINGRCLEMENHPTYIDNALKLGYDVEIDVWFDLNAYFLGHDFPQYEIDFDYIENHKSNLWCHAKNLNALVNLVEMGANCFWHQNDDRTITTKNYIWTYPNMELSQRSICVNLSDDPINLTLKCAGVCSDYIENWRNQYG